MRGFLTIYRKELYAFWASPILYIVAGVFSLLAGYFFYSAIVYYHVLSIQMSQNPFALRELNATSMVLRPFFFDISIVFLLLSPLLTMKLFAEEKKTGTIELLLTYPLTDGALVLAKFTAVLTIFLSLLVLTTPSMIILGSLSKVSVMVILSGYLGTVLMGGAFLALGLFTSSLTQNQIVAATLSFGSLLGFWIISWMKSMSNTATARLFEYLSITTHFEPFVKGLIDLRHLVYYVVFITFFLFLTLRRVDVYRWRG